MAQVANKQVLVIDTKDDKVRKQEAVGLQKLCQDIRNSEISKYVSRTIMAIHDPDCQSIFNVSQKECRNYALIEVCGLPDSCKLTLDMCVKMVTAFLSSHKYKVSGSKTFKNKEYPVCKLIVKFQ